MLMMILMMMKTTKKKKEKMQRKRVQKKSFELSLLPVYNRLFPAIIILSAFVTYNDSTIKYLQDAFFP